MKKQVLNVLPIQNILEKLPVVPVGNAGTIPHHLQLENAFPDASRDCRLVFQEWLPVVAYKFVGPHAGLSGLVS